MLSRSVICNPKDWSPPDFSVHGISQTRILEWVAISFSRGSSQPRDWTLVSCVSCTASGFFMIEPPGKLDFTYILYLYILLTTLRQFFSLHTTCLPCFISWHTCTMLISIYLPLLLHIYLYVLVCLTLICPPIYWVPPVCPVLIIRHIIRLLKCLSSQSWPLQCSMEKVMYGSGKYKVLVLHGKGKNKFRNRVVKDSFSKEITCTNSIFRELYLNVLPYIINLIMSPKSKVVN